MNQNSTEKPFHISTLRETFFSFTLLLYTNVSILALSNTINTSLVELTGSVGSI